MKMHKVQCLLPSKGVGLSIIEFVVDIVLVHDAPHHTASCDAAAIMVVLPRAFLLISK